MREWAQAITLHVYGQLCPSCLCTSFHIQYPKFQCSISCLLVFVRYPRQLQHTIPHVVVGLSSFPPNFSLWQTSSALWFHAIILPSLNVRSPSFPTAPHPSLQVTQHPECRMRVQVVLASDSPGAEHKIKVRGNLDLGSAGGWLQYGGGRRLGRTAGLGKRNMEGKRMW